MGESTNLKGQIALVAKRFEQFSAKAFAEVENGKSPHPRLSYLFVIVVMTALLLVLSVVVTLILAIATAPTKPLIPKTDVLPPDAFVRPVFVSFFVFLVIMHLLALGIAKLGKAGLQAMEYTYLLLGAFGLLGVTAVGIDEADHGRNFFNDQIAGQRAYFASQADVVESTLCGRYAPTAPSIETRPFCDWITNAKTMAAQPLNGNSSDDRKRIADLFAQAKVLAASLPVGSARTGINSEAWRPFVLFLEFVDADAKSSFDYLLERGGYAAAIDSAVENTKLQSFTIRELGVYLLGFAIALRISKLSVETFGETRKGR